MNIFSKILVSGFLIFCFSIQVKGQSWVLKFDPSQAQSFIDCGNSTDFASNEFTLEAWVFVDNWAGNYIMASESWNNDNGSMGFAFRIASNGRLEISIGTGNWEAITSPENVMKLNQWQHVAVSVGQDKSVNLYTDGTEVANGTLTHAMIPSITHLFIGEGSTWQGRGLDGKLSDVRIWNTKRQAADILADMNKQLTGHETGLQANWPLNEGTGSNITDKTGLHNCVKGAGTSWVTKSNIQAKGSLKILDSGKDSVLVSVSGEIIDHWSLAQNLNNRSVSFSPVDDHSAYLVCSAQTSIHQVDTLNIVAATRNGSTLSAKVPLELYDNKYQYYGEKLLDQIQNEFYNKSNGLYAEQIGASSQFIQSTSFLWPATHMLRALKNAWILNPEKYENLFFNYLTAMEQYKATHNGSTGYGVLPDNSGERFYDDNGLLIIQFSNIYDQTKENSTLNNLKIAYEFNNDVHDSHWGLPQSETQLGYGMFYSMAVNQTSYGAAKLYQITNDSQYLDDALKYYNNQNNLSYKIKDASTKLFNQTSYYKNGTWSLSGTVNGTIHNGGGYRAYQTTVVVQNAILLYQITKDSKYLNDAIEMTNSCLNYWYQKGAGLRENSFWGGDDLIDALLDLYRETADKKWLDASKDIMDFLSARNRDLRGYYASDYDDSKGDWNLHRTNQNPSEILLMGQAAAASSFLNVAINTSDITSGVKELNQNAKQPGISVYPNPVRRNEDLRINVPEEDGGTCNVRIYNQSGQLVRNFNQDMSTANPQLVLNTTLEMPGLYLIQIFFGSKSYQTKLLVL